MIAVRRHFSLRTPRPSPAITRQDDLTVDYRGLSTTREGGVEEQSSWTSPGGNIVLAGSPVMTGWRRSPEQAGIDLYVVDELKASEPDGLVEAALSALAPGAMVDTGLCRHLEKSGLMMMHTGDVPESAAYGETNITASAGKYRILKHRYSGPEGSLWVFRLARSA